MQVQFHKEASSEVEAIAGWYESRRPGLGEAFLAELTRGLDTISESPSMWPEWPGAQAEVPIRRFLLPRFPYAIAFLAQGDAVVVLAVAHTRREPRYWLKRAR